MKGLFHALAGPVRRVRYTNSRGGTMMRNFSWCWKLLAVAAIVAATPLRQAAAQGVGVLRGVVRDSVSQQPVAGAQVQLVGTNRAVATGLFN